MKGFTQFLQIYIYIYIHDANQFSKNVFKNSEYIKTGSYSLKTTLYNKENRFDNILRRKGKKMSIWVKYFNDFIEVVANCATSGSLSNVPELIWKQYPKKGQEKRDIIFPDS